MCYNEGLCVIVLQRGSMSYKEGLCVIKRVYVF